MILLQLCRIYRRVADVNSIRVISQDIGGPDIDNRIIAWEDDKVGPLGFASHFVASLTILISSSVSPHRLNSFGKLT